MAGRGRRRQFGDNGFGEWGGYMEAKKLKLEGQFRETAKKENIIVPAEESTKGIFDGVAIYVNGYTDPTADELKRIMMLRGGLFHHYPSSRTTHIIAKNLPDVKVKALKGNELIVHPSWIVECVKANKLLDYKTFLLYTNQRKDQSTIGFQRVHSTSPEHVKNEKAPDISPRKADLSPIKKSLDSKDERFLGEFYNNSRLHLISTMKTNFKNYVAQLRENSDMQFPEREQLFNLQNADGAGMKNPTNDKIIMHIDMDCFFVSVSLRKYPHLRGKPVAVAHGKGNSNEHGPNKSDSSESWSEIASCSYEARKKGVENGMFVGPAKKLCQELQIISYDFEGYQSVAKTLYDSVAKYTLDIQAVSCDEMLVDLSSILNDINNLNVVNFAEKLRNEIYDATECIASVGLGPNILLAKLATRKAKPDGVYLLGRQAIDEFMKCIHVRDLPGVGWVTAEKLMTKHSVETCENLQHIPLETLKRDFGEKTGQSLYNLARGNDDKTNLDFTQERKSVSAEVNYGIRFTDMSEADKFIHQLSEEVSKRLLEPSSTTNLKLAKQLTLKLLIRSANAPVEPTKFLGCGMCDSFSKSVNLSVATSDANIIKREAMFLLKMLLRSAEREINDLRGIGIQMSKFEKGSRQMPNILNFMNRNIDGKCSVPSGNTGHVIETRSSKSKSKPVETTSFHNLSMSQIDKDMLDALPKDIKDEITQNLKTAKKKDVIEHEESEKSKSDNSNQDSTNTKSLGNISFSQFDPNVLNELPIELQQELREQFSTKTKHTASAFDKIMSTMSSKQQKYQTSPAKLGRGRGRPPKNSPKFIKKSHKIGSTSPDKTSPQKMKKCLYNDKPKLKDIETCQAIKLRSEYKCNEAATCKNEHHNGNKYLNEIESNNLSSENDHEFDNVLPVGNRNGLGSKNICTKNDENYNESVLYLNSDQNEAKSDIRTCKTKSDGELNSLTFDENNGATAMEFKNTIEELRPLLRQWINSFATPTYDDVETVAKFFKSKIRENNLELVHMGLKSLCRNCLSSEHPENWSGAYNGIVREVQRAMLKIYGKRLSVKFEF